LADKPFVRTLAWFVAAFMAAGNVWPSSETASEYAIKAAFLFNIIKYAEWAPGSPLSDPSKPIVVAIVGDDPFGSTLDDAVRDRTVRGRRVLVVHAANLKSVKQAHVAFISSSEASRAGDAISALNSRSTLTVGDTEAAAQALVMVNFVVVQGRVRFDVNQAQARRNGIELSSQLLKLARYVHEAGGLP
jgi:hypothetical protein